MVRCHSPGISYYRVESALGQFHVGTYPGQKLWLVIQEFYRRHNRIESRKWRAHPLNLGDIPEDSPIHFKHPE